MTNWTNFARAACMVMFLFTAVPGSALAQNCGQQGGRPCTIFERVPSCNAGLIESGGRCVAPTPCGYQGERACLITERVPSCNAGLIESGGRCVAPPTCGGQNQRACLVTERLPSCNYGLVENSGRCVSPTPCGGQGQRACLVTERMPSCDQLLVEINGRCAHPACGNPGQRACLVTERIPSCDTNLIERNGRCEPLAPPQQIPNPARGTMKSGDAMFRSVPVPPHTTPAPTPSGCAQQTFVVKEACGTQPPALWFTKSIFGCTFDEAARSFPPQPNCRYIR
jgi:hypothetical protein